MADLSIPRSSIAEQQVLFKIIRPIVRLQYRAAGVNNISLPRDFADPARIARFLTDSCSLQVEPSAADPDLLIDITCQASSYYHDETEETELKAEAQIQIQEKTGAFKRTKSEPLSYEKSYRRDASVPVGLFLWEVSSRLNKTVKSILESW